LDPELFKIADALSELLFNLVLGKLKRIRRDWNSVEHTDIWSVVVMFLLSGNINVIKKGTEKCSYMVMSH
jgi:hypothetical protein